MKKLSRHKKIWLIVCAALALLALLCALGVHLLSERLFTQHEAERWQGDSTAHYSQHSVFIPSDQSFPLSSIYTFRYAMLDALKAADVSWEGENYPFRDAWSSEISLTLYREGKPAVQSKGLAVGGHFFEFHPLTLVSGSYISEDDIDPNRILINSSLAWLLFGGYDLAGTSIEINGQPFTVAGVFTREDDSASDKTYDGLENLFIMNYEAYQLIDENASASCYEVVLPDPVKNFSANLVQEKITVSGAEFMENSKRFSFDELLKTARSFSTRSVREGKVSYPYWENAARITTEQAALLNVLMLLFAAPAVLTALVEFIRLCVRGKNKWEDDTFPALRDKVEEFFRARGRARWEKKHGIKPGED